MECVAPSLRGVEGLQLPMMSRIGLLMDGVTSLLDLNTTVTVHQSPTIDQFDSVLEFSADSTIMLTITVSAVVAFPIHIPLFQPCNNLVTL
jgi:hypothetical protein